MLSAIPLPPIAAIRVDPRTLSEIIGHSKVSLTMQLYVHSDMEKKRAALNSLENL